MDADSGKYDLPKEELERTILGLLTAADTDQQMAVDYWQQTFGGPDIPLEDLHSFLRLHGKVIWYLALIVNSYQNDPVTRPYSEAIRDALRTGRAFTE